MCRFVGAPGAVSTRFSTTAPSVVSFWRKISARSVPAETVFAEWRKDPDYVAAYDALDDEFSLANALIEARHRANMTQQQVAARMKTTQTVVARLEGGRTMPSTRTLQRYAAATGTKLRIRFEPADPNDGETKGG